MTNPTECKYCGCDKCNADSVSMTRFRCGSTYWPHDDIWQISDGCAHKCVVQLVELRERVQRAVEALDDITSDAWEEGVMEATRILRGNSPETPDSSPITTDDPAVAEERIRRAIDALKNATRYRVTPVSRTAVEWDTSDDGSVTDSAAVDEAIAILEGEKDETT